MLIVCCHDDDASQRCSYRSRGDAHRLHHDEVQRLDHTLAGCQLGNRVKVAVSSLSMQGATRLVPYRHPPSIGPGEDSIAVVKRVHHHDA